MTAPVGRHDGTGLPFDADRDPGCIRAAWVAQHDLRHLPERIHRHHVPDSLTGADRMGGGQDPMADYLWLKGELA